MKDDEEQSVVEVTIGEKSHSDCHLVQNKYLVI